MTALSTGALLGDFRIECEIAHGGMGVVYRATQVSLERPVALKVIAPDLAGREDFRDRFMRESRLAASLDHPNVIPVYAAGEDAGVLYIAMRYVDGTDLRGLITRHGSLDFGRAIEIVRQLASALDAAHDRGLVHRDVKPGNVLVTVRRGIDHVYLMDFGLTKRIASGSGLTGSGEWVGTLDYVAPEQIRGDPVDGRADIYSLGCVLYETLTGCVPFPRENDLAKLWAHVSDPPPLATDLVPEVPPGVAAAARRAMAKSPDERFASAGELVQTALGSVADDDAALDARLASTRAGATIALDMPRPPKAETPPAAAERGTPATTGRRRDLRHRPGLVAAVVVVVLAVAGVARLAAGDGDDEPAGGVAPERGAPAGTVAGPRVRVGDSPTAIAGGAGSLWVANTGADSVSQVDARSSKLIGAAIPVGEDPGAVAVGAGSVWVANFGDGTVTRIDPRSGRPAAPIAVGRAPIDLVVGRDRVWVATQLDRVVTIDARTGLVVGRPIRVRSGGPLAFAGDFLWVADEFDGTLRRVSLRTREVAGAPIAVGGGVADLAAGPTGMWAAVPGDGTVKRVTIRGGRVSVRAVRTGGRPELIALGDDGLWVADRDSGSVFRLDARSGRSVGAAVPVGEDPTGMAIASGSVWVSDAGADRLTAITPR